MVVKILILYLDQNIISLDQRQANNIDFNLLRTIKACSDMARLTATKKKPHILCVYMNGNCTHHRTWAFSLSSSVYVKCSTLYVIIIKIKKVLMSKGECWLCNERKSDCLLIP